MPVLTYSAVSICFITARCHAALATAIFVGAADGWLYFRS